ncbi:MAG: copper homeostasis protein CutC, partial [Bowdeniella nasicola]|nr:copper homeostasis protein CutC [Bowdeniella nasicola]
MAILEICVEGYDGAKAGAEGGADRVELCDRLDLGGTTPPIADLRETLKLDLPAGVAVMIRPRGGNFIYTPSEVEQMCAQAAAIADLVDELALDAHRVQLVTGAQLQSGDLDCETLRQIQQAGRGLAMVCHRAFDETRDLFHSLKELEHLGFTRVLTAGGPTARAQTQVQQQLVDAASTIEILVCGGVRPHNLAAVMAASGANQVHMRAPYRDGTP